MSALAVVAVIGAISGYSGLSRTIAEWKPKTTAGSFVCLIVHLIGLVFYLALLTGLIMLVVWMIRTI